jgi:hypothetical protein
VTESDPDALHARSREMLNATYQQVIGLHAKREAWRFFNESLGNAEHDEYALDRLTRWYVDTQGEPPVQEGPPLGIVVTGSAKVKSDLNASRPAATW